MQALFSKGMAAGTPAGLASRLQRLFRNEAEPSWAGMAPPQRSETLELRMRFLERALRAGGRGTAPGLSGWRFEHLRCVLQLAGGSAQLLPLVQLLVSGVVPPAALDLLAASSLTPLAKPQDGVRPLAIGEVLRRITARAVCIQCCSEMSDDLRPQ